LLLILKLYSFDITKNSMEDNRTSITVQSRLKGKPLEDFKTVKEKLNITADAQVLPTLVAIELGKGKKK
jgi:hypothetical protein